MTRESPDGPRWQGYEPAARGGGAAGVGGGGRVYSVYFTWRDEPEDGALRVAGWAPFLFFFFIFSSKEN